MASCLKLNEAAPAGIGGATAEKLREKHNQPIRLIACRGSGAL